MPIPPLSFTGGAAGGGSAQNRGVTAVGSGFAFSDPNALSRLVALTQGSSENGGFTDEWNQNTSGAGVIFRADANGWVIPVGLMVVAFLVWKYR